MGWGGGGRKEEKREERGRERARFGRSSASKLNRPFFSSSLFLLLLCIAGIQNWSMKYRAYLTGLGGLLVLNSYVFFFPNVQKFGEKVEGPARRKDF